MDFWNFNCYQYSFFYYYYCLQSIITGITIRTSILSQMKLICFINKMFRNTHFICCPFAIAGGKTIQVLFSLTNITELRNNCGRLINNRIYTKGITCRIDSVFSFELFSMLFLSDGFFYKFMQRFLEFKNGSFQALSTFPLTQLINSKQCLTFRTIRNIFCDDTYDSTAVMSALF